VLDDAGDPDVVLVGGDAVPGAFAGTPRLGSSGRCR
jgi:hypothetical protein